MKKQTFINEARREQIVEAAIQTLDEIGFIKASLAQIAKRANISTALISYHFSDKQDLMNHVLERLLEQSSTTILEKVFQSQQPVVQLKVFVKESLQYQYRFPKKSIALIEIVFNAKTPDNTPYYRLHDDGDDPISSALATILLEGQKQGLFRSYPLQVMIDLIQGPIGEAMFNGFTDGKTLETYGDNLIEMICSAIKNDDMY